MPRIYRSQYGIRKSKSLITQAALNFGGLHGPLLREFLEDYKAKLRMCELNNRIEELEQLVKHLNTTLVALKESGVGSGR